MIQKRLLILTTALIISACIKKPELATEQLSLKPTESQNQITPITKIKPTDIHRFQLTGAMAARNSKKAWTASVAWQQNSIKSYQITLSGPLGSGAIRITQQGSKVTLRDGPKTVVSDNPETMLLKQTGVKLPVYNLYYWVRGIQAPGSVGQTIKNPDGTIHSFNQNGYHIEFSRYQTVSNASLPGFVKLEGNGILVKLVIQRWRWG